MLSNVYLINGADKYIYSNFDSNFDKIVVIICLYVDYLLIFGTILEVVHSTKRYLASKFDLKDMGEDNIIRH
jgi:hypothetical protein